MILEHTYETKHVYLPIPGSQNLVQIGVSQCLKDAKGNDTSEAHHLNQIREMVSKVNYRGMSSMKHTEEERKEKKKRIYHGANKGFANKVYKPK